MPSSTKPSPKISSAQGWLIWLIAGFFYLYEMVLRVSPSVMTQDLMLHFGITSTQLGILVSFYYYAYTPLQIPCGLIIDRLGPKRLITLSSFLCTLGTFLFLQADAIFLAQIGRFMIGAGSACAFISCLKLTVSWFPAAQFAFMAGLTNMMGTLGGTFAGRPLATWVNAVGWREALWGLSLIGIGMTILSWIIIKDSPVSQRDEAPPFAESLKKVLANSNIWLAGIAGGFMYLPISAFAELWAVPFLMNRYQISNELASSASIMIFVGMALGSPVTAILSHRFKSYTFVMRCSTLITSLLFFVVASPLWFPLWIMFVLLFVAGFTISGQVLCFTCAKNLTDPSISGTTVAFTNALVMLSGAIFQPLLGAILDLFWDGALDSQGTRIYSEYAYRYAMMTIPVCLFLSLAFLLRLKETFPR